jgi:hypothetical protein
VTEQDEFGRPLSRKAAFADHNDERRIFTLAVENAAFRSESPLGVRSQCLHSKANSHFTALIARIKLKHLHAE